MRKTKGFLRFLAYAIVVVGLSGFRGPRQKKPPNVILILTDDMGYGDLE